MKSLASSGVRPAHGDARRSPGGHLGVQGPAAEPSAGHAEPQAGLGQPIRACGHYRSAIRHGHASHGSARRGHGTRWRTSHHPQRQGRRASGFREGAALPRHFRCLIRRSRPSIRPASSGPATTRRSRRTASRCPRPGGAAGPAARTAQRPGRSPWSPRPPADRPCRARRRADVGADLGAASSVIASMRQAGLPLRDAHRHRGHGREPGGRAGASRRACRPAPWW